ncbi:hypothetical protein Vretifemale_17534, partial [Volvox reticuliferus]
VHYPGFWMYIVPTRRWCLAPSGGGHGHRQTLTAAMGCLPLVISDLVMQPFEPEMDWEAFSMRVAQSDVPGMHTSLDAVDDMVYDRMQAAVQCAAQHLLYSSSNGAVMQEDGRWDAFETILEILRMQQLHPGLHPRSTAIVTSVSGALWDAATSIWLSMAMRSGRHGRTSTLYLWRNRCTAIKRVLVGK